jgi:ABC-type transport system involved in multi-copper enzyme maturation permease subunit
MIGKFLTAFLGTLMSIVVLIGGVAGMVFLAAGITSWFGPYSHGNIETVVMLGVLIVEMSILVGCVRACEDL